MPGASSTRSASVPSISCRTVLVRAFWPDTPSMPPYRSPPERVAELTADSVTGVQFGLAMSDVWLKRIRLSVQAANHCAGVPLGAAWPTVAVMSTAVRATSKLPSSLTTKAATSRRPSSAQPCAAGPCTGTGCGGPSPQSMNSCWTGSSATSTTVPSASGAAV